MLVVPSGFVVVLLVLCGLGFVCLLVLRCGVVILVRVFYVQQQFDLTVLIDCSIPTMLC